MSDESYFPRMSEVREAIQEHIEQHLIPSVIKIVQEVGKGERKFILDYTREAFEELENRLKELEKRVKDKDKNLEEK